ncbi:GNAT family N-acetyltransferase [Nocardia goodfellowii]
MGGTGGSAGFLHARPSASGGVAEVVNVSSGVGRCRGGAGFGDCDCTRCLCGRANSSRWNTDPGYRDRQRGAAGHCAVRCRGARSCGACLLRRGPVSTGQGGQGRSSTASRRGLGRVLAGAGEADRDESGFDEITSSAFVVCSAGVVVSAAGYRVWPNRTAHVSVLTASDRRGQGLARAAASAAVEHALRQGLVPQWRARTAESRRVAAALGFRELGAQLSLRLNPLPGEDQAG